MSHPVTENTLQASHNHLYVSHKGGKISLEAAQDEHTVWNFEDHGNGVVCLQDPIHKAYLSLNHQGQLHLVGTRDHTCHLNVVFEDIGAAHHGVRHQAFHNKDRQYLSVPIGETKHLHTHQLKHGDAIGKSEWFAVNKVAHSKDPHHHQHAHHGKDHQ